MVRFTAIMYDDTLDLFYEVDTIDMYWIRLIEELTNDVYIGVL